MDQKCLLKTELEVLETKLKDSFSELETEFSSKTTVWGPRRVSIVKQQEVKRDPIVSGEKIQIGFDLNVVRESRTFQATVRAKTAEDSVNYFGDRFSSASHILCLHLRPQAC